MRNKYLRWLYKLFASAVFGLAFLTCLLTIYQLTRDLLNSGHHLSKFEIIANNIMGMPFSFLSLGGWGIILSAPFLLLLVYPTICFLINSRIYSFKIWILLPLIFGFMIAFALSLTIQGYHHSFLGFISILVIPTAVASCVVFWIWEVRPHQLKAKSLEANDDSFD
ncbi:hypothetical protein N9Z27_01950 [Alphaproteobacteria bacterium]|nr:hypothetical protein [Alphaproteobacteria bacterium]